MLILSHQLAHVACGEIIPKENFDERRDVFEQAQPGQCKFAEKELTLWMLEPHMVKQRNFPYKTAACRTIYWSLPLMTGQELMQDVRFNGRKIYFTG